MPPKRNKPEDKAPSKSQQTLEKWLSPIKKKTESYKPPDEPAKEPEPFKMQVEQPVYSEEGSSSSEHVQTRKQSNEKIEKRELQPERSRKAARKPTKVDKPEPKSYRRPSSRSRPQKKAAKRSQSPSYKQSSMEVYYPSRDPQWKINDPKYAFLFHETVLSETYYIFDKNDMDSMARYRKVSDHTEYQEPQKRHEYPQPRTRNSYAIKQPSKKKTGKDQRPNRVSAGKEKNNSVHSDDPV